MTRGKPAVEPATDERVRFDQWLWAARFFKTRNLAAAAIASGQARLNAERAKPAHAIRIGDCVSVRKEALLWEVIVTATADRRGSASDASKLYRETEAGAAARMLALAGRKAAAANTPRFSGRPTKRERRQLADFLAEP